MFMKPAISNKMQILNLALDCVQTNIMIADENLTIIHMNPSAKALMQEAEQELQKELPRFSVATLVGSNIDVFHKNPDHQRNMLSRLDKRHFATISIGQRVFDLIVTPVVAATGRIGFVVEWADAKFRLMNAEYTTQLEAVGRSQSTIEFLADGTIQNANENFLSLLGYRLDEIKGKSHSMFVQPSFAGSPEYKAFWDRLRSGQPEIATFTRIGKGGKEVLIKGSYNPIKDHRGVVTKIVKFATDISGQMEMLADLKVAVDQIDNSVASSTREATSAATGAATTLDNAQSVAASAEQLAASVNEIAQSMAKSRAATEDAAAQALAVGTSTESMTNAAQAMNGIVGLIRTVASQINLLALNATIEAARAGDAGKGFAVVASEVKNLAIQAARATEQITSEIDGIQALSTSVAGAITKIGAAIGTVREQVTLTASAVEEQTAVTSSMSSSMQTASTAIADLSASIGSIGNSMKEVFAAVEQTKKAALRLSA
jgi:PAS domain S-box-containing protein